jgi:general secretion pathway protein G
MNGSGATPRRTRRRRGFTLIELMLTLIVVGLLGAIALPSYRAHLERSRVAQTIGEMKRIEMNIERYVTDRGRLPATLAAMGAVPLDPWGNPYQYLPMAGASVGQVRKDHAQHPLNTDYDLYSMGADGESVSPLTARKSRDDIVRARNGAFVDLASKY